MCNTKLSINDTSYAYFDTNLKKLFIVSSLSKVFAVMSQSFCFSVFVFLVLLCVCAFMFMCLWRIQLDTFCQLKETLSCLNFTKENCNKAAKCLKFVPHQLGHSPSTQWSGLSPYLHPLPQLPWLCTTLTVQKLSDIYHQFWAIWASTGRLNLAWVCLICLTSRSTHSVPPPTLGTMESSPWTSPETMQSPYPAH